ITNQTLSSSQKDEIIDLLADVREHYCRYRTADSRLLADQEVNWIHTQGELGRVLDSARQNKLTAEETENAIIASMFSDSVKFADTAVTKGNFTTHHLDGEAAARLVLARKGFKQDRIESIAQAVREHQVGPPEFMASIYYLSISGKLESEFKSGAISADTYNRMKAVLDDMTVIGQDKVARIKKIADTDDANLVKNKEGQWQVPFSPEEMRLIELAGIKSWQRPHDPRYLAGSVTEDLEFAKLPAKEQERRISAYRSSRSLIDGDSIDNYATAGGASKYIKIRGPESIFRDDTLWDSLASVDKSYKDAYQVMSDEGRKLAAAALAERDLILYNPKDGIRAKMDNWLRSQERDPGSDIPFYNKKLSYPEKLDKAEQNRLKELQLARTESNSQELKALQFKGLNDEQIADFLFAKKLRDQMTDFLRQSQRIDGNLPGTFPSASSESAIYKYKTPETPDKAKSTY
ncbi:MAG: hypothetical protein K2X27_12350, partial [Candidatus Obscuribacterales bacterium]|nr:hypothetical protein [Candidatus Obscuribacterales bacterium]